MADVPLPPCPQCGGELDLEMRTKGLLGAEHRPSRPDYSQPGLPHCAECGLPTLYDGVRWVHSPQKSMWLYCTNSACGFEEEGRGG